MFWNFSQEISTEIVSSSRWRRSMRHHAQRIERGTHVGDARPVERCFEVMRTLLVLLLLSSLALLSTLLAASA